jgi:hypothetical protein
LSESRTKHVDRKSLHNLEEFHLWISIPPFQYLGFALFTSVP